MIYLEKTGKVQHFEWGYMVWLIEPNNLDTERLSVCLVTLKPYVVRGEHKHAGEEQVFHVIKGHGTHIINGMKDTLNVGESKRIPPNVCHNLINDSSEELKILVISTPTRLRHHFGWPEILDFNKEENILNLLDLKELKELLNKLSEAIKMSLAIIDTNGRFLITSDNFSSFCSMLINASNGEHCLPKIREACRNAALAKKPNILSCPFQITGIILPIYSGDNIMGYIKCGQVLLNKTDINNILPLLKSLSNEYKISIDNLLTEHQRINLEPKNRLFAAAEATTAIANYITGKASVALRQKELDKSKIALLQEQVTNKQLEQSLQEIDLKLLQSKINPHFLFNTLNTIAQMAYLDGSYKVANLLWDLSGILRCILHKTDQLITLREEIMVFKKYMDIQLSRFGDRLRINLDIDSRLNNAVLPCMLFQPLVENAIIHGFEHRTERGIVTIRIHQSSGNLVILVEDNGQGFDPDEINSSKGNCLGIQSVKSRLHYYYGDSHVFHIDSKPGKGTKVLLSFPKTEEGSYERH